MKISYAITYKDEWKEIDALLQKLNRWLSDASYDFEIVVLQDADGWHEGGLWFEHKNVNWKWKRFENDFSAHKNYLNSLCTGDYIFQLDADEYPSTILVDMIGSLIESNPDVDLIWVPRVNTVEGITSEHILKWNWTTTALEGVELLALNWPDYQARIYRNNPKIHWVNKVHEWVEGADKYTRLPAETIWAIYHPKNIAKQEKQNEMYSTMQR